MQPQPQRQFHFSDHDFATISKMVHERTGIVLASHKRDMVYSRLARRLRSIGIDTFSDYLNYLTGPEGNEEVVNFVNAITTNLTSFFRESHHFDHLKNGVLIPLAKSPPPNGRVRIWSAGCSAGAEPYTIAMMVREVFGEKHHLDIKILATDIDTNMLATASKGEYPADWAEKIPPECMRKYVDSSKAESHDTVQMKPTLQQLISFKQLNLLEKWPIKGPFDVIFCRNVVIYFDKETQRVLFDRYADMLKPKGNLYIGHSENLFNVCDRFELLGKSMYQRVK